MSDYPATLGDLTDVEARLDAAITRLENRLTTHKAETEKELTDLVEKAARFMDFEDEATAKINALQRRVDELEKLWIVAKENPELVRELAVEALKGRGPR